MPRWSRTSQAGGWTLRALPPHPGSRQAGLAFAYSGSHLPHIPEKSGHRFFRKGICASPGAIPMPATPDLTPLTALSASLAGVVGSAAASVVSVHSHRAVSSGFAWKPGLIVTADEALADEGEVAVTLAGGERVRAMIVGRDPTTDIALLRIETAGLPPVPLDGAPPPA